MRLRLLVLTAALALTAAACGPVDWVMFRFGPARTGSSSDTTISKDAVQSSMVLNWTGTLGSEPFSSPAVAQGVVYIGAQDGKFYAFDTAGNANCSGNPKSCAPLWTGGPGGSENSFVSSPAVVGGVVYVGSLNGKLYAFDAAGTTNCSGTPKTCQPLWTGGTGSYVLSSPAVRDGLVYVGSGDPQALRVRRRRCHELLGWSSHQHVPAVVGQYFHRFCRLRVAGGRRWVGLRLDQPAAAGRWHLASV